MDKENIRERVRKYIKEYNEKYNQRTKEKYNRNNEKHREERRKYAKIYYQKHREKLSEQYKKYQRENKEKIRERRRKSRIKQRKEDPKFCLDDRMSSAIRSALKGNKAGRCWETLVGYTLEQLMQRLSVNFTNGMSFDNYGEWHIDHRKPKSLFRYDVSEEKAFKDCWSLVNLQPLWATDNFRKSNKYLTIS